MSNDLPPVTSASRPSRGRPRRTPFDLTTPEGRNAYARDYRERNRERLNEAEKDRYLRNKALSRCANTKSLRT